MPGHHLLPGPKAFVESKQLRSAFGQIRIGYIYQQPERCTASIADAIAPALLNAKLPANSFAADLSPILRRYFLSRSQENLEEILERAYVTSDEITESTRYSSHYCAIGSLYAEEP